VGVPFPDHPIAPPLSPHAVGAYDLFSSRNIDSTFFMTKSDIAGFSLTIASKLAGCADAAAAAAAAAELLASLSSSFSSSEDEDDDDDDDDDEE